MYLLIILAVLITALMMLVPLLDRSNFTINPKTSAKISRWIIPVLIFIAVVQLIMMLFQRTHTSCSSQSKHTLQLVFIGAVNPMAVAPMDLIRYQLSDGYRFQYPHLHLHSSVATPLVTQLGLFLLQCLYLVKFCRWDTEYLLMVIASRCFANTPFLKRQQQFTRANEYYLKY